MYVFRFWQKAIYAPFLRELRTGYLVYIEVSTDRVYKNTQLKIILGCMDKIKSLRCLNLSTY